MEVMAEVMAEVMKGGDGGRVEGGGDMGRCRAGTGVQVRVRQGLGQAEGDPRSVRCRGARA